MAPEGCKRVHLSTRLHRSAIRAWPFWELPRRVGIFISAVTAIYVTVIGFAVATTPLVLRDLLLCGALMLCTAATVELTRRAGENAGVIRDVYAVWELPLAILLPPVYALVVPAFRFALTQYRIRRVPLYRRVFSAAGVGLSYACASVVFHAVTGEGFPIVVLTSRDLDRGTVVSTWTRAIEPRLQPIAPLPNPVLPPKPPDLPAAAQDQPADTDRATEDAVMP